MKKQLFNDNWYVTEKKCINGVSLPTGAPKEVTLPYDAMHFSQRTKAASVASASYPTGKWEYRKVFSVPADWCGEKTYLHFEGVYQNALVYVNGDFVTAQNYGYAPFTAEISRFLHYGSEENEVLVIVHVADGARWYSGAGIYRDVYLYHGKEVYIPPQKLKVETVEATREEAVIRVRVPVKNDSMEAKRTVRVHVAASQADGRTVAEGSVPLTILQGEAATADLKLYVENPKHWDTETGYQYVCSAHVAEDSEEPTDLDQEETRFGIRTFSLSPKRGFALNGVPMKLKGAGLHHENGPIGAVSLDAVEERKVRALKDAGFNAVRTAHNPPSPAFLRACDKYGMLVMLELFDTWGHEKVDFDNTLTFGQNWEHDMEAVVDEAYNHPSVLMYSIGNEIADTGSANGAVLGRKIAQRIKELDPTRYSINCINGMVSAMGVIEKLMANSMSQAKQSGQDAINGMMNNLGETFAQIMRLDLVADVTEECCSQVDICGYNYMDVRYETDREKFPNRVICGTETFTPSIDVNWKLIEKCPNVIGDFCWTGWDYVGEPATGLIKYEAPSPEYGMGLPYPALLSQVGEFTISGLRRTVSYFHEIVTGHRKEPYIGVFRPKYYGKEYIQTPWAWSDTAASWSWDGYEGSPIRVEVYSDAEEVELWLNGKQIGRKRMKESDRFQAEFELIYEPGILEAVAYMDRVETGRFALASAFGEPKLMLKPEQKTVSFENRDIIYLPIEAVGENGECYIEREDSVTLSVEGPAELLGFGSDNPVTEEGFDRPVHRLYDGRALVVLRPTGAGVVTVHAKAEGLPDAEVKIEVRE